MNSATKMKENRIKVIIQMSFFFFEKIGDYPNVGKNTF